MVEGKDICTRRIRNPEFVSAALLAFRPGGDTEYHAVTACAGPIQTTHSEAGGCLICRDRLRHPSDHRIDDPSTQHRCKWCGRSVR